MNETLSEGFLQQDTTPDWACDEVFKEVEFELDLILDPKIKHLVMYALRKADMFWKAPAGEPDVSNYLDDEYKVAGLLLHTKRTVRAFYIMKQTLECTLTEQDCAIAALLMRNSTKPILIEDDISFDPFHIYTVEGMLEICLAEDNAAGVDLGGIVGIPLETLSMIFRLIRVSNGIYSPIPETVPTTVLEKGVALAVILSSNIKVLLDDESNSD